MSCYELRSSVRDLHGKKPVEDACKTFGVYMS